MSKKSILSLALAIVVVMVLMVAGASAEGGLTPQEELGKALFFDENLSAGANQSCATCHDPAVGWTGPDSMINAHGSVYPGSYPDRFGDRKPPTAAYGGDSPVLYFDEAEGLWIGGMFWDGRATGWILGDPLAEQAQGPFLNPVEQALLTKADVVQRAQNSKIYGALFAQLCPGSDVDQLYDCIGYAISAYEKSSEVNPFTSKFDYWLKGEAKLTGQELRGLELFEGKAMCSACHISEPGPNGEPPLFTDFSYDNLGIPKNPENPVYAHTPDFVDPGLGGFLRDKVPGADWEAELGKHKVPTLRNVDLRPSKKFVKAYGHNGYFKSLDEITHFYNTRDVEMWPDPEVPETVNTDELGNLGLTKGEENAIVAFMKTLSDGYVPTGK